MKTILIVDDIADNLKLLKELLTRDNYLVKAANNGKRCLEIVKKSKPDLILLDIMMPDMNGYEVCKKLKENADTKDIPVIFVTAKGDIDDETYGFEVGAVDYISKPISAPIVRARVKNHLALTKLESYDKVAKCAIVMLAEAGHFNDTDTGYHIWRMGSYAKVIAKAAGWRSDAAEQLGLAATMHDTGKIGISDVILRAPRKLTDEEWVEMKKHPEIGARILRQSKHPLFKLSAIICQSHHEKYDGSGYPEGLKAEEIPVSARIVAIADVFDALTMKRAYKKPWSIEEAIEEIKNQSGKHFDPKFVDIFIENIEEIIKEKNYWENKEDGEEIKC